MHKSVTIMDSLPTPIRKFVFNSLLWLGFSSLILYFDAESLSQSLDVEQMWTWPYMSF
jgi:hypothetical protein